MSALEALAETALVARCEAVGAVLSCISGPKTGCFAFPLLSWVDSRLTAELASWVVLRRSAHRLWRVDYRRSARESVGSYKVKLLHIRLEGVARNACAPISKPKRS